MQNMDPNIQQFLKKAGLLHVGRKSDKNFAELLQSEHIDTPERMMWLTPDHLSKLGLTLGQIKDFTDLQHCCKHVSVEKDPEPGSVQVWDVELDEPKAHNISCLNNLDHDAALQVDFQINVNELIQISSEEQTFQLNLVVCAFITLADYPFTLACKDGKGLTPARCVPSITFVNMVEAESMNESAAVFAHPTLGQRFKYTVSTIATFASHLKFKMIYPFDTQLLAVDMCVDFNTRCDIFTSRRDKHVFVTPIVSRLTDAWRTLEINGHGEASKLHVSQYHESADSKNHTLNHVVGSMIVQRRIRLDVCLPFFQLLLVTVTCFAAFAVPVEDVADRLSISFTALLTIVAFSEPPPDAPQSVASTMFGLWRFVCLAFVVLITVFNSCMGKLMACDDGEENWAFQDFHKLGASGMLATHHKYLLENENKNYTNDSQSPWCFQELHDYTTFAVLFALYAMMFCVYTTHMFITRTCEPKALTRKLLEAEVHKSNHRHVQRSTTRRQITPV